MQLNGLIDAHSHVWTPDVERFPVAAGYRVADMQPPSFTPEELLALARPCGGERVVLIQMSFYGFDNSFMLDAMRRYPGTFSGVAVIDEDAAPEETMRALAREGVGGFRIHPRGQAADKWLGAEGMAAMWRCAVEENLAICPLINPDSLPALERMCERFPRTPV